MPLTKAQCENCGAVLEVDSANEKAVCRFCGTHYVVEKAIQNYVTNNQYVLDGAEVHFVAENVEKMLADAEILAKKLKQPEKARQKCEEITDRFPGDYRGWLALARIGRTSCDYSDSAADSVRRNFRNALTLSEGDEHSGIEAELRAFETEIESDSIRRKIASLKKDRDEKAKALIKTCILAAVLIAAGLLLRGVSSAIGTGIIVITSCISVPIIIVYAAKIVFASDKIKKQNRSLEELFSVKTDKAG